MTEAAKYKLLRVSLMALFAALFVVGIFSRSFSNVKPAHTDAISTEPRTPEETQTTKIKTFTVEKSGALETRREIMDKLRNDETNPDLHNELGIAFVRDGLYSEAVTQFFRTLELDPKNAAAYNNLGIIHEFLEAYDEAAEYLKKAVELDPENKTTASTLRRVEFVLEYQPKGEDKYKSDLNKALETMNRARPDIEKADTMLETVLLENPSGIEAINGLGIAKARQGKIDEAVELFNKAITMEPGYIYSYVNLATIHESRGDFESAIDLIESAINLADESAVVNDLKNRKKILESRLRPVK